MKIGILTFHRAHNYGAYLQACALCNRLNQEEGIEAELIDYRATAEVSRYDVRSFPLKKKIYQALHGTYSFNKRIGASFDSAMENPSMKLSKDSLTTDSLEAFRQFVYGKYDAIVVGSDEVWKVDSYRGFPTVFWLFGDMNCRKLSYAASARVDFQKALNSEQYAQIQQALSDFEFIGVRDSATECAVSKALNDSTKVHLCCDPTFLYDFEVPDSDILGRIGKMRGFQKGKKNALVMLDNDAAAEHVKNEIGDDYNLISAFHPHKGYLNCADVDPFEWLYLIRNTDIVIASFFHAICFSIINNRPFIAIGTKGKKSKLTELLNTDKLSKRYIEAGGDSRLKSTVQQVLSDDNDFSDYVEEKRSTFIPFLNALKGE